MGDVDAVTVVARRFRIETFLAAEFLEDERWTERTV